MNLVIGERHIRNPEGKPRFLDCAVRQETNKLVEPPRARITNETVISGHYSPDILVQISLYLNHMSWKNILGIDVAKDSLVIYDQGKKSTFNIANSVPALKQASIDHGWQPEECLVGLESTSNYSFLPMQYFVKKGFSVKLLNPIVTKQCTRATVRAKKQTSQMLP